MEKTSYPRSRIAVIHRDRDASRSVEGSLKLRQDLQVFSTCADAALSLPNNPLDLILCELAALLEPDGEILQEKIAELGNRQPPVVLLTRDVKEDRSSFKKLNIKPRGYVPDSIRPQMLNWLVSNWISPSRLHDRPQASDMSQKRTGGTPRDHQPRQRSGPERASGAKSNRSPVEPLLRPMREPSSRGGSIPRRNRRKGDSSDSLLWVSRLLFLFSRPDVTRDT